MNRVTLTICRIAKRGFDRYLSDSCSRFHNDDVGAAYSLSVVMMLPIYILFIGMAIEVNLLLNSHHAVSTATQVAGHAVRAWLHHRDALSSRGVSLEEMVHECVARNLLPFAVSTPNPPTASSSSLSSAWLETGLTSQASDRYASKLEAIRKSLRITIVAECRETEGMAVQLTYDSPLYLHAFEPVLATARVGSIPVRTITAQTWVALPEGDAEISTPGIPYEPLRVTAWRTAK